MDKPSGICIVSPNTKALALHFRMVLALNSFILISSLFVLFCFGVRCVCVVLGFWMHFIYKCVSRVLGFYAELEATFGFCVSCTCV
jgi:hypothetical protein